MRRAAGRRRAEQVSDGERAVLIWRRDPGEHAAAAALTALAQIGELGYVLAAVVDPDDFVTAHQLIVDDLADVIVVTRSWPLPSMRLLSNAARPASALGALAEAEAAPVIPIGQRHRRAQPLRQLG